MSTKVVKVKGQFQIKRCIFKKLNLKTNRNKLFMRDICLYILFVCFSFSVVSQELADRFPDDFFGIYTGNLHISSKNASQTLPMEFHLLATDSVGKYTYTLVYGEGETKQIRDYTLLEKDKEKGAYVVDENNGILLDCTILRNKMYTLFEVNNTLLTTFITFEKKYLVFEIIASAKSNRRVTHANEETKTEVLSYPITTIQRAVLKKQ